MWEWFGKLVLKKLDKIISLAKEIREELRFMSAELDALEVEVSETKGVEESAIVLLEGLKAQLDQLAAELAAQGIDNAKVLALSAQLDESANRLAAAVAAYSPPV